MSELGELIVLLQYQMSANRLKVLVRKAEGIPNKDKIPGGSCGMSQVKQSKTDESSQTYFVLLDRPTAY